MATAAPRHWRSGCQELTGAISGTRFIPSEIPEESFPVHMVLIRDMGMMIGEMFDLEELADDCASDGVHDFLLCAPVLKFTHGVGSPVNPIAIK